MPLNPSLAATAAPPIMEVQRWVRETTLPAGLPLINLSQAAPAGPPPEGLRRQLADAMLNEPAAHLYGPVLGNAPLRAAIARRWSAGLWRRHRARSRWRSRPAATRRSASQSRPPARRATR